jgi:hypothetical protein
MKTIISILLLLSCQSIFARTINSPIPPVELTSFTGQVQDSYVQLLWTTASEVNNIGFMVERAIQIGQWKEVFFVKGKGTTSEPQQYEFKDGLINMVAKKYYYRLKQIDFDGTINYSNEIEITLNPIVPELLGNYPNPFNPTTTIKFALPVASRVKINVYNTVGQLVETLVDKEMESGYHEVNFDASRLASGVYLYQLQTGAYVSVKKMLLLK